MRLISGVYFHFLIVSHNCLEKLPQQKDNLGITYLESYDLRGNAFNPLALLHLHVQSEATLESAFNIHVGEKLFIPSVEEDLKWGLCKKQTENYVITFSLNLNLICFSSINFILLVLYLLWDIKHEK